MYPLLILILSISIYGYANDDSVNINNVITYITDIEQRVLFLEEENSKLINTIEEMNNKISKITKIVDSGQITDNKISIKNITKDKDFDILESGKYNECINLLSDGKFSEAENKFKKFIQQYPKSLFLPEAYYWIGEINFAKENYKEASIFYLNSYKKNPKNNKSIESIFKLALALKNTDNPIGACHTLKSILTDFDSVPNNIRDKVNKELTSLRDICSN